MRGANIYDINDAKAESLLASLIWFQALAWSDLNMTLDTLDTSRIC